MYISHFRFLSLANQVFVFCCALILKGYLRSSKERELADNFVVFWILSDLYIENQMDK